MRYRFCCSLQFFSLSELLAAERPQLIKRFFFASSLPPIPSLSELLASFLVFFFLVAPFSQSTPDEDKRTGDLSITPISRLAFLNLRWMSALSFPLRLFSRSVSDLTCSPLIALSDF